MLDIIIPVFNIKNRGLKRIYWSLESLSRQTVMPNKVYIIDGSNMAQYSQLKEFTDQFDFCEHISSPMYVFNKPVLHNIGIQKSNAEWIMCTDADYLFKQDFIETTQQFRNKKTFLLKAVGMLPSYPINIGRIEKWRWPKVRLNIYEGNNGENLANGACQYTTRKWFLDNPYDERMEGWGAMDNLQIEKAKRTLEIFWMEDSEILHQYHPVLKNKTVQDQERFNHNQQILKEFVNQSILL